MGHRLIYGPLDLKDVDAVIVRSATTITKEHLKSLSPGTLKLIIRAGVGLDNIDTNAARQAGIQVRNTPDAPVNAVAELAIGHIVSCARSISIQGHQLRTGKWEKKNGTELWGKRLGILGYGRIGKRIAQLAKGFGMIVSASDPAVEPHPPEFLPRDQLLRQSDILVLAMPAMKTPVLDRDVISQLKDGVIVINISRGCNVDEFALLEGLRSGKIRAAGLDVWENEPNILPELRNHPAVSCTPHIGASTVEAQERIGREIVRIIRDFSCASDNSVV